MIVAPPIDPELLDHAAEHTGGAIMYLIDLRHHDPVAFWSLWALVFALIVAWGVGRWRRGGTNA